MLRVVHLLLWGLFLPALFRKSEVVGLDQTLEPECGGFLLASDTQEVISSPPSYYETTTFCNWTIQAPADRFVKLQFQNIDLNQCCDNITVSQADLEKMDTIAFMPENSYYSYLGGSLNVVFESFVTSDKKTGFRAVYVAEKPGVEIMPPPAIGDENWPWCVTQYFVIDDSTKYFTSINYPEPYINSQYCVWVIVSNIGSNIELKFEDFETESCCDYVMIQGTGEPEPLVLKGNHTGEIIRSKDYYLTVFFKTDGDIINRGFNASYKAFKTTPTDPRTDAPFDDCGGEIIVRGDGKINSPGYPMKYRGGLDCWWRLATENDDHRISIEFETVETENCCDFVEVYDGNDLQKKLRGTYYTAPVYSFTSTGNTVRIHFHSDNENEMKGFSAYFILEIGSKIPPISPSNATFIGTTDVPSVVTGTIPVSSILSTIQSVASTISMAEEQTTTIKTTTLPVQTTTQSPECGETSLTASDSANRLQFPLWRSTFSGGILCVWSIRAPEGLEIELEFSYIDVNECCDFIEVLVKDGADEGIQFHHFTSLPGVSYVVPVGGVIKVTYNTFGLMPTGGFRATYYTRLPEGITMMISTSEEPTTVVETTAIISEFTTTPIGKTTSALSIPSLRPKSCERTLRKMDIGRVYVLQSPDRDSSNCRWRFRAARGLSIRFRFIEFDIQPQYGNFTILDAPKFKVNWDKAKALQIINGKRDGFVVEVDYYLTAVKYNIIARQPGFVLVYESFLPIGECGYTARATEKDRFMKSPGWPKRPFKGHIKCNWTIESAVKRKEVSFALLEFYAPSEGDSLMIYDGSKLLANIQDSLLAPTFYTSTKGKLQIIYEGMEHDDLKGFHGVYKIDLPTTASPTTAEKTTFRAVRPSVVNTPTATATAVCISVQLLTEVSTNMLSTTDLPTTASPTTAEGTTFRAARPSVVNTPTATATAVQLLTEVTNMLSTTGPPATPSFATDAPGYSTVGISVAISASATTATVQLMTDVATKMLLNTDGDKPTTPSLDTYVNNSTLSSDTDASTDSTDADKPTTPSSDTYVNNSTLSSDINAPTYSTAAISIAMSPSATTAAAQLLTDVFTEVSSTTGPIPAIKCYEILISGVPGNPNNMKNAAQCLPGHKCVLVKSQLRVPLTETTIESVYGSCVPESICLQDTCREISEVFPMLGSNCTSYCCDEDFCNDYKMPEPEVTAAPQLKCYSIVETSAVGKTSQLTQMNVQECAAGSTCLYVKVLASMTIGETSSKVSSVTSFGNCFPKALKETYGCEQIFSSMNSLNPGIAMSVISCGVYFCDTDLCNSPQSVEIIIPNIDNEETTTEKAVEQTTAPSITSTGSSTTGIDCFDMLQVSLTGKPPVHDVKNTTSCDLGWKCVYAEAEMESDGIFLQVIYGTCVPNALCDNDPCNQIATILPDLSMDYNLKRCTARCCEQNLCNERISTAIVESTTIHTVSTFMLQTVSTPILTTPDTDPNTLQCYSIQKIESSLNYLNADVNNVLTCSSGSVCYFLTSEYYISVGNVRTKVKMTSANCRDSCQDDCSDLSRVIQGSSGVNVDVQSCTSYCCSEDLCNADKKIVTQTTQQSITDMNATHSAIEKSSKGLMCYNTLIADLPAGQTINQQAKDDCGNNSVCMLVTVDSTVYTSDSESFSATMVFGSCFPASSRSSTSCEQLLSNIDIASTYTNGNVTFDKCILSFCHEDFCNNPEASLVPHIPDIKEPVGPSIQCYVINNVESKFDMLNQDTKSITMCPAGSSCHLIKADVHMRTNLFSTNVTITNGRCIASAFCEYSDCKQFRDFLPSEISEVSYDIIDCKSSCCSEDLCNDIDEIPVLTTMTSQETTVVTKPPGITKGLLCYTTLITDTSGYKAINQQTETDCGEDAVCVLLQVESSVLSDYGTSKVTTTYGSCFSISARDYTGCELMLNDVQKESAMSASIKEVTIENCRLSFCETNLCNDHNGPPLPTHVPSVVITDAGEPIECYVIQNIESPVSVVNSKSQTIRQCPAGSSCQLVEADMSFSGFGGFGSSMKIVTGNCILTAMCKFSNCEQMKNLLPSNVAGVSFTLNSCKTSCCDSNLCNDVDVEENTTYKPGEYTTQSVLTSGLSCYTTLITETSGYKAINQQTETDCGEDAVCVLLQVESSVLSNYGTSKVGTTYGSCFPISARDYTGCELMLNDVQKQSGISTSIENVTIESCRLSFCETNLCNDHTGPPLPTHVPSVVITDAGDPIECYVIQNIESPISQVNSKSQTIRQCPAGSSCQLVEANMSFSSGFGGFGSSMKVVTGNCILTAMCKFSNCEQMKNLLPSNVAGVSFTLNSCKTSCCDSNLCNDVDVEGNTTYKPEEPTTQPVPNTGLSCYTTLISETSGYKAIDQQTEMDCGEDAVCVLLQVETSVLSDYGTSKVTVTYGSCFPVSARDYTGCEMMLNDVQKQSGMSASIEEVTIESCRLSFCETNLCNVHTGPPLPTHVPSIVITDSAEPIECYVIQNIESPMSVVNSKSQTIRQCPAGSSCQLVEAGMSFSSGFGGFGSSMKVVTGNCILTAMCKFSNCEQMKNLLPSNVAGVSFTLNSCKTSCCDSNLCNDVDVEGNTTYKPEEPTTQPVPNTGLSCYTTLITETSGYKAIDQQTEIDCGEDAVCVLLQVETSVLSDYGTSKVTVTYGSCFPVSAQDYTGCEMMLNDVQKQSGMSASIEEVTIESCRLSFCETNLCNDHTGPPLPTHVPSVVITDSGEPVKCYVIQNIESPMSVVNSKSQTIRQCPAGSSCQLVEANMSFSSGFGGFGSSIKVVTGNCILTAMCKFSNCEQMKNLLPSNVAGVSFTLNSCKTSCCDSNLCNDVDMEGSTTYKPEEPTTQPVPNAGLSCYTTLITETSGYKAINQQTEMDCGEDAVCVLLQVETSVLSDYGTSKVTITYGSCFPISARDYTGCELMLNDVQKQSGMSASIEEVTIESCRLSFCETNLCNDHTGTPLPTHVPSVVITDSGEPIECYVIQNVDSPLSVVNSKSQTIRQCPAGSSCQLVEADMSFSRFGGFGSSMKVVTGNCILTAMCEFSNCEQMKNLLPSNVAGVSFTLNSCKTSCCDSNLCNGVDVEEDTTYKPGEYTTQSVITTGLSCYTTLITEISEYKLINEQTETDCGKDAVCVLLQVESSVLSDYDYGSEVLTIYGSCFPISARDYTGCELMFNDVQEQSGMSASTDNITIESCRLSFCETNLCNDHTGPPLPTHVPTVNITGKAVECHVIQYVESSLTALNRKSHTRTQCSIGQSCQLVEAHMSFSSQLVGFNVNAKITNGNCIPTPMCEFANCHQLKDLMPTNLDGISFEIINCTASCCEGDLCNAVKTEDDVDESTNIPIASTWYSDPTGPSSGAFICYQTLIASSDGVRSVIEKRESWCGEESLCMLISIYGTVTLPGSASNGSVIYGSCVPKLARDSATCEFMMREIKGASGSSANLDQLTIHSCNLSFCETNLCNDETGPPLSIHVPSTKVTVPTELLECYVINNFVSGDLTVDHYTRKTTCLPGSSCSLLESRIEVTSEYTGHSTNLTLVSGNCVNTAWCRDINCEDLPDLLPENVGMTERILQCKLSCCSENLCNALTQKNVDEEPTDTPSPTYSVPTADSKLKCYNTLISESSGYRSLDQQEEVDCDEDSLCMLVNVHLYVTVLGIKSEVFTIYGMCYPKAAKDYATCDQIISKLGTAESINLKVENCDLSFCEKNLCNDHSEFLISKNATEPDTPIQCYVRQKVESDFPGIARDESSISTCAVGLICQTMTADMKIHSGFMNITMKVTVGNCVETSMCELSNCKYLNNLMPDSLQGLNGEVTGCKTKCCSDNLCNFGEDGLKYTTATTAPSYTVPGKSVRVSRCYETLISKTSGIQALNQQKEVDCDEDSICMLLNVQSMVSILGIETKVSTIYGSCYPKLAKLYTTCERMMSQVPALGSSSNMKVEKCSLSFCEEDLCNDHTKLVNQTKPSTTLQCYHMQHVDSDYSDVKKNELSTINCALGSSCQTMVADLRIISGYMNTSMKVTVGSCTPTAMCELNNCEYLNNVLPSSLQGLNFEVTGCKATCCSDSLCNYREDGLLNTTSTHGLKYTASTFAPSYTSPDIFDTDCYTGIGVDYRGFVSETVSGRSCQRWDSQSPHEHVRTPERFPYKGIISNNYCRNPDQEGTRPWCYTTDSGLRWEYCPVQQCSDPLRTNPVPTIVTEGEFATTDILPTTTKDVKEISCFFGTLETMVDDIHIAPDKDTKQCGQGFKCMLIQVIAYSPTVLTGSGVSKIVVTYGDCLPISTNCSPESCLPILSGTQDFSSEANITSCDITCCDTNLCNEPMKVSTTGTVASTLVTIPYTDCYTGIGVDYRGAVSVTVTGRTCQRWDLQTPHEHIRTPERFPYKGIINNNYCRNPDQEGTRPWCYTTDRGQRWEYCPVSKCSDTLPTTPFTTTATEQESTASNYVTTTPEESQAISCFHGLLETRADGVQLLSEKKIKTCGQGFVCMLITADAYAPSLLEKSENSEIMMIYGDCLPSSEYCSHERCLPILSTTQDFSSGLNLTSCDVTCCDTDLCNDPKTVLPTQPLVTTATTTPVSGMDPRECYNADDGGSSYRGNASTTLMGLTCQRWDSQTPHEHTRSSSRYPSAGLESNYCRNPDDSDAPWCYTIDADQRWEYCSIRVCQVQTTTQPRTTATNAIFKYSTTTYSVVTTSQPQTTATSIAFESTAVTSDICYTTSDAGASYRGLVAVTKSGKTCQQWDFQWPHEHSRTKDNYPLSGLESNYCRNPDGEEAPWCYTTDIDSRWEYCPIPKCSIETTSQPQTTATSIAFESTAVTSDICYTTSDAGASYRGLVSVTKSGKTCQQWDFQWPHEHSRTEDNYPLSGLESNYCRNPDGEEAPWCYTTDIDSRWEYCPIPKCSTDDRATTIQTTVTEGTNTKAETTMGPEKTTEDHLSRATMRTEDITEDHLSNCYYGLDKGTSYRGTTSTTIGGRTCQRWDLQTPHEHTRVPSRYPLSGLDENYCRNPDVDEKPWCYTTDRNKRWEYCAIEQCSGVPTTAAVVLGTIKPGDCYNFLDDGVRYRGFVSTTDSGRKCQRWDAQSPHEHTRTPERFSSAGLENNYCRNPDNDLRPWCYTTDINVRWEYCPVPECGAEETPTTTKPLLITETETSAVESPTTTAPLLITETETSAVESPTTTAANTKPLLITESETSAAVTTSAGCLTMNLDLVLLLDVSRPRAFRKSRYYTRLNEFVDNIVSAIKLGNVTNVSVIQFAQRSETMYDSHDYVKLPMGDVDRLQHFMENKRTLSQMSKRRAIYHNIEDATMKLMSSPRYSDECTKKLIVLFTTGSAADEKYESKAVNALTSAKIPLYISGLPLSKVNAAKFRGFADKLDSIDMHFTNDFADAQTVLLQFLYEYIPELRPEDGDE
ncbi:uncharacterized protein LOC120343914 isoform X10 [Styela clava]